ncbi:transcription-repair coupling factor [Ligilactobacillus equi]
MEITELLLAQNQELASWMAKPSAFLKRQLVTGLLGSAKTVFLATMLRRTKRTLLVVEPDLFHAQKLVDDLENLLADEELFIFPVEEMLSARLAPSSPDFRAARIAALTALEDNKPIILVTTPAGLGQVLPSKAQWQEFNLNLALGQSYDQSNLIERLLTMGYVRQKLVERPGDFAVRGSIIDIYPLDQEPLRLDFFDDELDAINIIDSQSQRSIEGVEAVKILPANDLLIDRQQFARASERLQALAQSQAATAGKDEEIWQLEYQQRLARFKEGIFEESDRLYAAYFYEEPAYLLDYLDQRAFPVFDDYSQLADNYLELQTDVAQWSLLESNRKFLMPEGIFPEFNDLLKKDAHKQIFLSVFAKGMGNLRLGKILALKSRAVQQFFGQMPLLQTEVERWKKQGQTVIFLISSQEKVAKFSQTLDDFKISALVTQADRIQAGQVQIVQANLESGFEYGNNDLVILTEKEIYAKAVKKKRPLKMRQTMSNTQRLRSYNDLKPGDYVVHVNHGIGRYIGLKTMEVGGHHQDYLTLHYADDAELFVPVTQLDRVQKYVASEGHEPKIYKLGSGDWAKTKRKVASKIEDIADDLVDLYAKREAQKGFAFSKDDSLQVDFDEAFPYPETPDQLRSIQEIKADMEKEKPMDRLLIGDVGFGKTEVALRAAFKAVHDGKQVAFLAPTTVLAQQHYETMMTRFDGFDVQIGILSRFATPKQVRQTLEELKNGQLDIIVGTHRLLSKDVVFADLGLLIIDEEQRFGVRHKERLKELKTSVDVLTLTATPIPRTLNLSMLGVRDLSVIETPPQNRYPIQTYIIEQNYPLIVSAIQRELARGGQVFYLHNRVGDIASVASQLESLVPQARVAYIHGRMPENQMEQILMDFIAGDYDVLVTTTIIETGVDIPNANTLLVEDADRMGLAQLYQLRGRVGRSNRVAYAYFMYQADKVLNEISEKRLEAIKDFTELGSGFKIAMRDLSIRGAGNILGRQQHGFIDSVGYDMYTQLLNEAVAKKRGLIKEKRADAEIILGLEAYLPADYIDDQRQKIEIYKRIKQMETQEQFEEIRDDLVDRFGEYPEAVSNLLEIGKMKMKADQALVAKIKQVKGKVEIILTDQAMECFQAPDVMKALAQVKMAANIGLNKHDRFVVSLTVQPKMMVADVMAEIDQFLVGLLEILGEQREAKKQ